MSAYDQFPALYGDGIFPRLATIIARYNTSDSVESRINLRMLSVHESIGHLFAMHTQNFALFTSAHQFQLLLGGIEVSRLVLNSFLLLNCYTCMDKSPNNFNIHPPILEEYLPLDKILRL